MWKASTRLTSRGVRRVTHRRISRATANANNWKKILVTNRNLGQVDALLRRHVGFGLGVSILLPAVLAVAGVTAGTFFPKFEATALLQFPEAQKSAERQGEPRPLDQRPVDPKANVIELAAYKRVAASYDSAAQLRAYLKAAGLTDRPGAERLLIQAQTQSFWDRVSTPVLPYSRRDQREFGDIKDASATTMLGLELTADARAASIAHSMVEVLAGYYVNAVVRERIRAWVLAGKVESQSLEKNVRADILRAELDIELYRRRAEDMKAVLARYPDAARMDSRQVVSVNPSEGGERYLSPLAQLVGAESAISQRQEMIRRWQRELKQKTVLAQFFSKADELLKGEVEVSKKRNRNGTARPRFESAERWTTSRSCVANLASATAFELVKWRAERHFAWQFWAQWRDSSSSWRSHSRGRRCRRPMGRLIRFRSTRADSRELPQCWSARELGRVYLERRD